MKIKTILGILGLLVMIVFVFIGQTFCDFLTKDYGNLTNALLWTGGTILVLNLLLWFGVALKSAQGAHVKTQHVWGIILFSAFVVASCAMVASSMVHSFSVMSRKDDIARMAVAIRNNTDLMYDEYQSQCDARGSVVKIKIENELVSGNYANLNKWFPNDNYRATGYPEAQRNDLVTLLMQKYDNTWNNVLRNKYESTLISNFSLFTGGAALKGLIAFNATKFNDFDTQFNTVLNPLESDFDVPPTFDFEYVNYKAQVADLFGKKAFHVGGVLLFIIALLFASCPFVFIQNNKVRSTKKGKEGEGIYSQGYTIQ